MLIYREAAEEGEVQNGEVQRYRNSGDAEIPEMGEGRSPLFPSFLSVFSSYLLDAEGLFCPSIWAL